jgi:hypothetical protein
MVEYGRLGRLPAVQDSSGGSSGIWPRPSRITRTTVPIMAAKEAQPSRTNIIAAATDIAMHLVA